MNNPLGVSPSKGKQGTTRGKEKIGTTFICTNYLPACLPACLPGRLTD